MHDVMTKSRSKISRQAIKKSPASKVPRSGGSRKGVAASAAKGKWVYSFGGGAAEGRASMRNLLGGKGAGLAALAQLGRVTGKKFGDAKNPLLVSVRSGARASMPGMMDTVLNLGLNDVTVN